MVHRDKYAALPHSLTVVRRSRFGERIRRSALKRVAGINVAVATAAYRAALKRWPLASDIAARGRALVHDSGPRPGSRDRSRDGRGGRHDGSDTRWRSAWYPFANGALVVSRNADRGHGA